jgi:phosphoserine phosphatase RsbU/P
MTDQPGLDKISPDHLLTLYQITRVINSSLEFEQVLDNVMDAVMHVTRAERGVLMIADDHTGALRIQVARNVSGDILQKEDAYSTTIVNQVVSTRQPLLTNNAMFDERFAPGQSIIMRGLRAILCAPMIVQERLVGVVYVDTSMRHGNFNDSDRDLLSAVAGQAGIAIENARLYAVAVEKGRMERELQMAREIQEGLLPREMPRIKGYEIAARWRSAREVAGDFYDLFSLGENSFGVVIADVSDKGAPSALFMAVARTLIRSHASYGLSPLETLSQTNDLILEDAEKGGMFVTVYHSVFRVDGYSVNVNAGHNPTLLYRHKTRQVSLMPRGGRAIGWFPNNPLRADELQLEPGDIMVYYTDGLTEAENHTGDFFGDQRLAAAMTEIGSKSAETVIEHIVNRVDQFCDGAPPFDDLTLLVIRYTG